MSTELILLLYLGGAALLMCELIMPSMLMGLVGVAAMATAIVHAYKTGGFLFGTILALIGVVGAPLALYHGLKRLALKKSLEDKEGCVSAAEDLSILVNEEGVAITPLRPSGTARISGRRVDVVTEGDMIESGARVRVIKVEGARVIVKKA
ncbi:MAG: NfeD family protein [Planctomycetota bacterium]